MHQNRLRRRIAAVMKDRLARPAAPSAAGPLSVPVSADSRSVQDCRGGPLSASDPRDYGCLVCVIHCRVSVGIPVRCVGALRAVVRASCGRRPVVSSVGVRVGDEDSGDPAALVSGTGRDPGQFVRGRRACRYRQHGHGRRASRPPPAAPARQRRRQEWSGRRVTPRGRCPDLLTVTCRCSPAPSPCMRRAAQPSRPGPAAGR